jgi:hypothetical protein
MDELQDKISYALQDQIVNQEHHSLKDLAAACARIDTNLQIRALRMTRNKTSTLTKTERPVERINWRVKKEEGSKNSKSKLYYTSILSERDKL